MLWKIGLYGSAVVEVESLAEKAIRLGQALGKENCTVITGACSGLPYFGAREAASLGSQVIGYSPVRNIEEQGEFTPEDDLSIYTRIEFTPDTPLFQNIEVAKKYRNVLSTANCDAGIIIAGRWGTLHEFCSLADYGKAIGVLTGTGFVADALNPLQAIIRPEMEILFEEEPEKLVARLLEKLERVQKSLHIKG